MGDINTFEQQLLAGFENSGDVPPEMKENGIALKKEISRNPQHLLTLIQNFSAFKDPRIQTFTLQILVSRLRLWAFLESQLIEPIRALIFQSAFQLYDSFDDDTKKLLSDAQSQFSIHQYPNPWEDMWTFIFAIPNQTIIQYFLNSFCRDITLPDPSLIDHYVLVKQHLKGVGAEQQIYSTILQGMTQLNPISFSTLASFCHWASLSFLEEEAFKQVWEQGIQNEATAASTVDICSTLISRSMSIEQKVLLINNFNMIGLLGQICSKYATNTSILYSSAIACSTAGRLFLEYGEQIPQEFLQQIVSYSILLLQSPSDEIVTSVSNFLYTYTQRFNDVSAVLEPVMQRLYTYFSSLVEQKNWSIGTTATELSKITYSTLEKHEEALTTLVGLMGGNPFENPCLTASVLFLIPYASRNSICLDQIVQILQSLIPILETIPPFDLSLFFVIYNYLNIPIQIPQQNKIPPETIMSFFNYIIRLASSSELPYEMAVQFGKLLPSYVHLYHQQLKIAPDLIINLVSTLNVDMISAAGGLISSLEKEIQGPVISQCLGFLKEKCKESRDLYPTCCSFPISLQNSDPWNPEVKGEIASFLQEMMSGCSGDFTIISIIIKGLISLDIEGFTLFQQWVFDPGFVKNRYTIPAICETVMKFIKLIKVGFTKYKTASVGNEVIQTIVSFEWLGNLAALICDTFIEEGTSLINDINNPSITEADLNQYIYPFFKNGLLFFGYASYSMNDEIKAKIRAFLKLIFEVRYDNEVIVESGIDCLLLFGKTKNGQYRKLIAEEFTIITMNFLFAPNFDPNSSKWEKLIQITLKNFQVYFMKNAYQQFCDALKISLKRFGVNEEFVSQYLLNLEDDLRKVNYSLHFLFNQLQLARSGNTWE